MSLNKGKKNMLKISLKICRNILKHWSDYFKISNYSKYIIIFGILLTNVDIFLFFFAEGSETEEISQSLSDGLGIGGHVGVVFTPYNPQKLNR